jgi:hypothetical protein
MILIVFVIASQGLLGMVTYAAQKNAESGGTESTRSNCCSDHVSFIILLYENDFSGRCHGVTNWLFIY